MFREQLNEISFCLTLSCPGTGRGVVKIGYSNLRPGSKELLSFCTVKGSSFTLNMLKQKTGDAKPKKTCFYTIIINVFSVGAAQENRCFSGDETQIL